MAGFLPPDKPKLTVGENDRSSLSVRWETTGEAAWLWVLQYRTNEVWTTEILPAHQTTRTFENSKPDLIAVSAVDRAGNLSSPAAIKKAPAGSRRERHDDFELSEGTIVCTQSAARPLTCGTRVTSPLPESPGIGIGFGRAVSRILSALLRGERIICLCSRYPESVSLSRNLERAAPGFPIWPCTRWGFPCRVACA